jgi:Plasmid encoded RepA protein
MDDDGDQKPPRLMPRAQRRFLEAAERIRLNQPTFEDLAYMARELVQMTLPHRNPGDVPAWSRTNGSLTMTIRQGWDTRTEKPIGYPYGTIPRLLLFWLTAEAVRTRCRTIELGSSLSEFMFQLGLDPSSRGPRSDARRLRDQMERLFRATISFDRAVTEEARVGSIWINMEVASAGEMWWSQRDPSQAALWGSWIELGEKFFRAITAHPVPLDMRALKALKSSPLGLDLYSWLTYEAYRAHKSGKGRFVAWKLLAEQMGSDYARTTDFQHKAVAIIRKIQALYPALRLGSLRGGIRIEPDSLPAITPRPTAIVEHAHQPPPEWRLEDAEPSAEVAAVVNDKCERYREARRAWEEGGRKGPEPAFPRFSPAERFEFLYRQIERTETMIRIKPLTDDDRKEIVGWARQWFAGESPLPIPARVWSA